jgi:hypothetical protein
MVGWTSRSGESPQLATCDIYNHLSLDPHAPVLEFEPLNQRVNSILFSLHPNGLEKSACPPGIVVENLVQLQQELKAILRPAPLCVETVASRAAVNDELATIQRDGVAGWVSTWDFDANKDEQGKLNGNWTPITAFSLQKKSLRLLPTPSPKESGFHPPTSIFSAASTSTASTTRVVNLKEGGNIIAQQSKRRKTEGMIKVCYPVPTLMAAEGLTDQHQNKSSAIRRDQNKDNIDEDDVMIISGMGDDGGASRNIVIHSRNGRPLHQTNRWDQMIYATTSSFRYILTLPEMEHYGRIQYPIRKGSPAKMLVVGVIRKNDDVNVEFAEYQVVAHLVNQQGKMHLHYKSYNHSLTGEFVLPDYSARSSSASLPGGYNTVQRLGYFLNPWSLAKTEEELRDQLEFYFEHGVFSPKAIRLSDKTTAGNF